jgi:hypothetical protein
MSTRTKIECSSADWLALRVPEKNPVSQPTGAGTEGDCLEVGGSGVDIPASRLVFVLDKRALLAQRGDGREREQRAISGGEWPLLGYRRRKRRERYIMRHIDDDGERETEFPATCQTPTGMTTEAF